MILIVIFLYCLESAGPYACKNFTLDAAMLHVRLLLLAEHWLAFKNHILWRCYSMSFLGSFLQRYCMCKKRLYVCPANCLLAEYSHNSSFYREIIFYTGRNKSIMPHQCVILDSMSPIWKQKSHSIL